MKNVNEIFENVNAVFNETIADVLKGIKEAAYYDVEDIDHIHPQYKHKVSIENEQREEICKVMIDVYSDGEGNLKAEVTPID